MKLLTHTAVVVGLFLASTTVGAETKPSELANQIKQSTGELVSQLTSAQRQRTKDLAAIEKLQTRLAETESELAASKADLKTALATQRSAEKSAEKSAKAAAQAEVSPPVTEPKPAAITLDTTPPAPIAAPAAVLPHVVLPQANTVQENPAPAVVVNSVEPPKVSVSPDAPTALNNASQDQPVTTTPATD